MTTNFDLCVETALRQAGVNPVVWTMGEHFDPAAMAGLAAAAESDPPTCYVLKVHGSANEARTVVDTLSQRSIGLVGKK